MSIKVAIGSKIYDISHFSDQEKDDILRLSNLLNYRVNQVISAFEIYDQEMALVIASLSLLEENNALQERRQEELFPDYNPDKSSNKEYSKEEMEEILVKTISSLTAKLKQSINTK